MKKFLYLLKNSGETEKSWRAQSARPRGMSAAGPSHANFLPWMELCREAQDGRERPLRVAKGGDVQQGEVQQGACPPLLRSYRFLLVLLFLGQCFSSVAGGTPDWSIVFFVGTDESEIGEYSDPYVKKIIECPLPPNIELLVEQDTFSTPGTLRVVKSGEKIIRTEILPEQDSADPSNLKNFFTWVTSNIKGKHRLFVMNTHSWGWRGIIQDYSIPAKPKQNTMMPLREFAQIMKESGFCPDIILFDCCNGGNAEFVHQMKDLARYLVVSQRETPFSGFPFIALFEDLGNTQISPRELARSLPEREVREYSSLGSLAEGEGEYAIVTLCAIDTRKWDDLVQKFSRLVFALEKIDFRAKLSRNRGWVKRFADMDCNVDMIELLYRLPAFVSDSEVKALCSQILSSIGYPQDVSDKTGEFITLDPRKHVSVELVLEGDPFPDIASVTGKLKSAWEEANQDNKIFPEVSYSYIDHQINSGIKRDFIIRGKIKGKRLLKFRPWLPGVRRVVMSLTDTQGYRRRQVFSRERDYFSVNSFPRSSYLLSEAHTQGAPFIHGIGLVLHPFMLKNFERSQDLRWNVSGPRAYELGRWNLDTRWGRIHFLNL